MRATIALLIAAAPAAVAAQTGPIHQFAAVQIAPRGDRIVAIENVAADHAAVVVRRVRDGGIVRRIDPCRTCTYGSPTFAADGRLAFLARDKGRVSVMLADDAGERQVAGLDGIAQTLRFSPDGRRLALLATYDAAKEAGAAQAGVRQVGEIGEKSDEQRIAVIELATGAIRALSPAQRYIYEYDWAPDGRALVATSALGNGDNNWWVATLDAIDAETGAVRQIASPKTQINMPRVSPDGRTVAYIGGLMSDFGSIGGDVWTVPLAGGEPVNLTAGAKATVTSLAWPRTGMVATRLAGDAAQVVGLAANGKATVRWSRPASFAAGDGRVAISADGRTMATALQDFAHAPALYAGPLGQARQITRDNDVAPANAVARSVSWKSDGLDVQGWLLAPVTGEKPAAKAPMVTIVHGGPASASTPNYVTRESGPGALLAAGYWVFLPNPRGSYGQGEAFTAANRRDFGGGDLRDILAGIDAVEKVAPIDDARLGLTGGSYGGFMSMWANTQTTRFKAIVAGAGLSNWISYYGTNGIDQWMIPFFGRSMYDDPEAYARVSAITFIRQAKTPTFIYVGERDIEVPPTQSIEYWHALKELGVPTSLVIYADEGHSIRDRDHAADVRRRSVAWFDRFLK
ncbi:S9 family peptidase [Sphingomonas cynarae]|uniref:S9 family peptidase n=1 Tax=Sphingomonas cynarae TaxID=930197 RepID=A0ABP7E867_9SPHN